MTKKERPNKRKREEIAEQLSDEYKEGHQAKLDGKAESNPYDEGTPEYKEWQEGYTVASRKLRRAPDDISENRNYRPSWIREGKSAPTKPLESKPEARQQEKPETKDVSMDLDEKAILKETDAIWDDARKKIHEQFPNLQPADSDYINAVQQAYIHFLKKNKKPHNHVIFKIFLSGFGAGIMYAKPDVYGGVYQ